MVHMGYTFVPPHNTSDYPPMMGTAQEQALGTKQFQQNQALFRRCTVMDGSLKKKIITAVQPVSLYPLVDQLTNFGQVNALQIIHHIFNSYGTIDKIKPKKNAVNMMGPYDLTEPLALLIEQLEKGRELSHAGRNKITNNMMVYLGITLWAQSYTFNEDIQEWRRQITDLKTWAESKTFLCRAHQEQKRAATTAGKGGYTSEVKISTAYTQTHQKNTTR